MSEVDSSFSQAKIPTVQTDKPTTSGQRLMKAGIALLSRAEVQSGSDRQKWAEGLILQLPERHDGRNSWLINYGVSDEAQAKRDRWNERAVKDGRAPTCVFNDLTRSTGNEAFLAAAAIAERAA